MIPPKASISILLPMPARTPSMIGARKIGPSENAARRTEAWKSPWRKDLGHGSVQEP